MLLAIASFLCRRKSTQDSHGAIYKKHATFFKMACACNVDVTSNFISKIIHSTSFLFPVCKASYYFEGYFIILFWIFQHFYFPLTCTSVPHLKCVTLSFFLSKLSVFASSLLCHPECCQFQDNVYGTERCAIFHLPKVCDFLCFCSFLFDYHCSNFKSSQKKWFG